VCRIQAVEKRVRVVRDVDHRSCVWSFEKSYQGSEDTVKHCNIQIINAALQSSAFVDHIISYTLFCMFVVFIFNIVNIVDCNNSNKK